MNPNSKYPSFVVYKSNDMINFESPITLFEGNDSFWATKQYWAPEMHKYKDKYYLFASLKSDNMCRGTQIFVSNKPDGMFLPLTEFPVTPKDWESLDGTLYVENGKPYIIFCHEWLQIKDGTICAMELSDDLKYAVSDPVVLFNASDAKWTVPFSGEENYVSDGPFIIKTENGLKMIWSSFSKTGYAIGICESDSILGPWKHTDEPIYKDNGGHAMVYNDKGKLYMSLHTPNNPDGAERLHIVPFEF